MDICDYLQEEEAVYIMNKYGGRKIDHLKRVSKYCEVITRVISDKYTFDNYEKSMLKYCALLHDIGYCIDKTDHHKHSKYIILQDSLFDRMPKEMRCLLALIVSSHRRKLDEEINKYTKEKQRQALRLISILRLADGLDYSEGNKIEEAYITENSLYLRMLDKPRGRDLEKFNRKAELFKESFKLSVNIGL